MPKKLTMVGVLMALVLGAFGLAGRSASANTPIQSFCTHIGAPADAGQCPALQPEPFDWYMCYDTTNDTNIPGAPASPVGPAPYTCGVNTSATAIPAGLGTPIKVWQVIKDPAGSRLTLPTVYSPPAWTYSSPGATTAVGDVTASTDILCTGGATDILATAASGFGISTNWPGFNWLPYDSIRQSPGVPVDADPATGSDNAYINGTRPMPPSYTDFSLDRANLTTLWLGGFTALTIAPVVPDVTLPNVGSPLSTLVVTSPYGTNPKVSVALLGGAASPPEPSYLCLQSPQDSVAKTSTTIPPAVANWYPRWALMTSDKDFVDGQRTRILDSQCIAVGDVSLIPDADGDCLSDAAEATATTNPAVADTDGDMVSDGIEVAAGMNPLAGDADGDLEDDYTEMFQFTNPAVADTDGDGSLDKHDDLAGFNCVAVTGVCTVVNLGDTTADDNCPANANASQLNTDSTADMTNTPNTPAGVFYPGDATNNHQDPQGDACDTDDDNDGLGDVLESATGMRILLAAPVSPASWCKGPNYEVSNPGTSGPLATGPLDSDTDNDGGLDGRECLFGSRPDLATNRFPTAPAGTDTDGDLLFPVGAETFYHTQAIVVPGGALENDLEQAGSYGSPIPDTKIGPSDPDSDGDFLNDGVEVKWYAVDPANFDTDADGCSDGREAADVNGDHKVNSSDGLGVAQHQPTGSLAPSPAYFTPATGVRRSELATYDINKDGNINSTDSLLVAKLTGNCASGVGAQTNTKPIIELAK